VNLTGGSFVLEVNMTDSSEEDVEAAWKTIVFSLVGNNFPYSEKVTGFRFMDRMKRFNNLKIEMWTTISY